jgi:hypothetical protein
MGNPLASGFGPGPPTVPPPGSTIQSPVLVSPTFSPAGSAGQVLTSQGAGQPATFTGAVAGTGGFTTPNPTAPPTNTSVMLGMGYGTTGSNGVTVTPARNGILLVNFTGTVQTPVNATAGNGLGNLQIRYGTGTIPQNGAAATGTAVGAAVSAGISNANGATFVDRRPFALTAAISGLTVGTQYWLDVSCAQLLASGVATIVGVAFTWMEQ